MEKANRNINIHLLGGDCDDPIDWEDFILRNGNLLIFTNSIQEVSRNNKIIDYMKAYLIFTCIDEITTSFNGRKLTSQFYLNKNKRKLINQNNKD